MKLTEEQIKILVAIAEGKPVEKNQPEKGWVTQYFSNCSIAMIMEYLTAGNIRIKAPATFIPLDQADWANGPWWVAKNVKPDEWLAVIGLHPNGITVALGIECKIEYWSDVYLLNCCIRSRTCLPDSWEVCGKEGV